MAAVLQPRLPDVVADGHAAAAEQHVQIALGARAAKSADVIRVAQMLADEGLRPDIHRLWTAAIERRVGLAKRQQQQIDQRIGDADGVVRRQFGRFAKRGMHEVMRNPAGTGAR